MGIDKQKAESDIPFMEIDVVRKGYGELNLAKMIENNTKFKDASGKIFLKNAILCAQFLKDYVEIPILKNIKPEDIEDVTERYTPLFTSEREADTVKRINLGDGTSLFLISLIEHKTKVDYNVIMQLLRYMCYIWEDYEKEMQKESDWQKKSEGFEETQGTGKKVLTSNHKDFKYPPILPIVYFEGTGTWTAVMNLKDRIYLADVFDKYIPDFTYEVIRPHDYTDEQLMEKNNEMGLIMLFNKLQSLEDFKGISVWKDSQQNILKESPQHILDIIARFMTILLSRLNLPQEEIEDFVSRIKEGNMPELFENFERVDVPKMREEIARQQEEIDRQQEEIDKQKEVWTSSRRKWSSSRRKWSSSRRKWTSSRRKWTSSRRKWTSSRRKWSSSARRLTV